VIIHERGDHHVCTKKNSRANRLFRLLLLHVAYPVTQCAADYCLDTSTLKQAEDNELLKAREMMQKELKKFPEFQEIEVISDIREGEPAEEILKEQEEKGVDLIVMPSHGRTGIMKRLMGQISEKVMEEAKSPVLLVRH